MSPAITTVVLLTLSNIFMTFAWYGHLKHKSVPLTLTILLAWGIAFFEYCLQVPANRIGHGVFTTAQLRTIQEVISLSVFVVFCWWYMGERLGWNHALGFIFIAVGAAFIFKR